MPSGTGSYGNTKGRPPVDKKVDKKAARKAKKVDIESQIKNYKNKGFPKNYGLFENNVLVRKHNDLVCIRIMESWWEEFCKYSQRDQLSFVYCLWKNNFSSDYIYSLGNTMKLNPRFRYYNH